MNGARSVHDELTAYGWRVLVADAQKVKGLAPLACKTDKVDARVLAELSWRRCWCRRSGYRPSGSRCERERARYRMHLVKHRTTLKNRVHSTLIAHGHQAPVSDLFGAQGRRLLASLELPDPWAGTTTATLELIDDLDRRIAGIERELQRAGAEHRYVPDPDDRAGYRLDPRLHDRGRDRRDRTVPDSQAAGVLHRPVPAGAPVRRGRSPRPALKTWAPVPALGADRRRRARLTPPDLHRALPADQAAGRPPARQQGRADRSGFARLAEAIWHMLTKNKPFTPFTPTGATRPLAATTAPH